METMSNFCICTALTNATSANGCIRQGSVASRTQNPSCDIKQCCKQHLRQIYRSTFRQTSIKTLDNWPVLFRGRFFSTKAPQDGRAKGQGHQGVRAALLILGAKNDKRKDWLKRLLRWMFFPMSFFSLPHVGIAMPSQRCVARFFWSSLGESHDFDHFLFIAALPRPGKESFFRDSNWGWMLNKMSKTCIMYNINYDANCPVYSSIIQVQFHAILYVW